MFFDLNPRPLLYNRQLGTWAGYGPSFFLEKHSETRNARTILAKIPKNPMGPTIGFALRTPVTAPLQNWALKSYKIAWNLLKNAQMISEIIPSTYLGILHKSSSITFLPKRDPSMSFGSNYSSSSGLYTNFIWKDTSNLILLIRSVSSSSTFSYLEKFQILQK